MDKITKLDDVDIAQLFLEERQSLKSPADKDKRRSERIEIEEYYINVRMSHSSSLFCTVDCYICWWMIIFDFFCILH